MKRKKPFQPFQLRIGDRLVRYEQPAIMGILNVTPDSFYDGGRHHSEGDIVDHVGEMLDAGADIIDIGVVSSRPGAYLLPPDEERQKLTPIVALVRKQFPDAILSVDTCYVQPAEAALDEGANIINDIAGGQLDPDMFALVARKVVPYILMHNIVDTTTSQATTRSMQTPPHYDDILSAQALFFSAQLDRLHQLGASDIIIDPGFGFAKTLDDNYTLFNQLSHLRQLFPNEPLLVALSRKSMIYKLLNTTPDEALTGTTALHTLALLAGAQLLRVHDVRQAAQVRQITEKLTQTQVQS